MNRQEIIYFLLIGLIMFLFCKKILEIVIDIEFPTYKPPPGGVWKYLVQFRDSLTVLSLFYISGILLLMGKNTNKFITTILLFYMIYDILYFLFDWGYIYYFINKNPNTEHIVKLFDVYLNAGMNVFLSLFALYALVYIFYAQTIKKEFCK